MDDSIYLLFDYHIHHDDDEKRISTAFGARKNRIEKYQIKIYHNDILHNRIKHYEPSDISGHPNIQEARHNDSFTIEIWQEASIVAGGLYQVDIKQSESEKYILRTICSYGINLDQSNALGTYMSWQDDIRQQYDEDIYGGLDEDFDEIFFDEPLDEEIMLDELP